MADEAYYKHRIEKLERELDEMTVTLSQAWDQLVPFLQTVPSVETAHDIKPTLYALMAAADTEIAGMLFLEIGEWFSIPSDIRLDDEAIEQICDLTQTEILDFQTHDGELIHWAFAPIIADQRMVGVLGIGTRNLNRAFSAADMRVVSRMAERISGQFVVMQLARSREREALFAHEMQIANDVQQSIQPETPPQTECVQVGAYWQPAKHVGGDAWGWVQQSNGRLIWFILDVAGKGLPAALAAVALHTATSMVLRLNLSPADALQFINEAFYDAYTKTDLLATIAILSLNPQNGVLEIANAGHPPVLVRHKSEWLRLVATAPPIGVLPELQAEPQVLMLKPNDLVICYSDGFTEIQMPSGLWGVTGLIKTIPDEASDAELLTHKIVAASRHMGEATDDQTLVTVLYTDEERS